MTIKLATVADSDRVYEIWRECKDPVLPFVEAELDFYKNRLSLEDSNFPFWVAEIEGSIVGWACLSPMRTNPAVRETMAELSFYVSRRRFGQGIASSLLKAVISFATNESAIEWIHAWVSDKNEVSIRAVERIGGVHLSTLNPVNRKPNRDMIILYSVPVTGFADESNSRQE